MLTFRLQSHFRWHSSIGLANLTLDRYRAGRGPCDLSRIFEYIMENKIYTEVLGNINSDPQWAEKLKGLEIEEIFLDQWTAQKSRFLATGEKGNEYPVALKRHTQVADGDIIEYNPEAGRGAILRIKLNPILEIDLGGIADRPKEDVIRIALELGHAIGNQHWPAVVKGVKVYVPLTVDKKVMLSVLETHHIEGIKFEFREGQETIPYLAPHEVRELFGGASHESHAHVHPHDHHHHHH